MRTRDRSGAYLPILHESDEERTFEAANRQAKGHVDARREERSSDTHNIEKKYRSLLKDISDLLAQLVRSGQLSNSRLRIWMCTLKPILGSKSMPGIEMFYEFCPPWFDTSRLKDLIDKKLTKHVHPPDSSLALKVQELLKRLDAFNRDVDQYFSNRLFLQGNQNQDKLISLISLDPEWSRYPARKLYQLHKRACEALKRVRGYTSTVYFCSVLKEYILLNHVQAFVKEIQQKVSKEALSTSYDHHQPAPVNVPVLSNGRSKFDTNSIDVAQNDPIYYGCSCSQLDLAAGGQERVFMLKINKDFLNPFGL